MNDPFIFCGPPFWRGRLGRENKMAEKTRPRKEVEESKTKKRFLLGRLQTMREKNRAEFLSYPTPEKENGAHQTSHACEWIQPRKPQAVRNTTRT